MRLLPEDLRHSTLQLCADISLNWTFINVHHVFNAIKMQSVGLCKSSICNNAASSVSRNNNEANKSAGCGRISWWVRKQ